MENVIFPMKVINITQRASGSYSHKNLEAWDIAGKDTGIESAYAPCTVKVLGFWGTSHTTLFGSCDIAGNAAKVRIENGEEKVLTFALTHDNDISDITVGHIYKSGEKIYDEGTYGNATGNHVHIEVAEGWSYKKHKRSDGKYELDNIIPIHNIFHQLKNWNEIKNANSYTFKAVDSRTISVPVYFADFCQNCDGNVDNMPTGIIQHKAGETVKIPDNIPTRSGYKFLEWNSQPDGSGYVYKPCGNYDKDWQTTMWAQWQEVLCLADAMKAFKAVAKEIELTAYERNKYDIDGDGEVTLADAMKIFQAVSGK